MAGVNVELLRQRKLIPTAGMRYFPLAGTLRLHCPFQGSHLAAKLTLTLGCSNGGVYPQQWAERVWC